MVLHSTSRQLGYLYAGLCLTCSVLLLINACQILSNDDHSIVGLLGVIFATISCIFDVYLIAGIVLRRLKYVEYHLKFVSFVYVILLIGIFGGCIVMGILLAPEWNKEFEQGLLLVASLLFSFGLVTSVVLYTLTLWIIRGIMDFIKYENVRFVTPEQGEMV
ncbi:uncharacterized protein LOC134227190 isoform X2 [Armigeres subalbatus]|uniref:uncharacterized protein LOC134227190 isoform X2 n=1 Tax=Armigeres subalbatus TaxID=124917 RepID=UPI002ED65D38